MNPKIHKRQWQSEYIQIEWFGLRDLLSFFFRSKLLESGVYGDHWHWHCDECVLGSRASHARRYIVCQQKYVIKTMDNKIICVNLCLLRSFLLASERIARRVLPLSVSVCEYVRRSLSPRRCTMQTNKTNITLSDRMVVCLALPTAIKILTTTENTCVHPLLASRAGG